MTTDPHDRPSELLLAALAEERAREVLPADTRARLLSRLEARLALPAPSGPVAAPTPVAKLIVTASIAGLLGGVIGLIVGLELADRRAEPPAPPPAPVIEHRQALPIEPAVVDSGAAPATPTPTEEDEEEEGEASPPSRSRPPTSPRPTTSASLEAEQSLIDAARSSLAWGNATEALASLDRHATQFPDGQLAEDREALRVLAWVLVDAPRARAAADAFRRRYPRSLMIPAIDRALEAHRGESAHEGAGVQ